MGFGEIAAGASTLISPALSFWSQERTNKANKQMQEYAYSKDLEMWKTQNAYNSPSAQMGRLKEAGLNPNLIYGTGAAGATGQAKEMPKYQAPKLDYNYELPNLMQTLSTYQDVRAKNNENTIVEKVMESLIEGRRGEALSKDVKGQTDYANWINKNAMFPQDSKEGNYFQRMLKSELGKSQNQAQGLNLRNALLKLAKDWYFMDKIMPMINMGMRAIK